MSNPSAARDLACVAKPGENPEVSTGPTYLASEDCTFFAETACLTSDTLNSTPTHNSWFRTGPWLPRVKAGQASGYLACSGQGRKQPSCDALPAQARAYNLQHTPALVAALDSLYQPNETSRTCFAQLEKAGKLPTDCR